MLKIKAPMTAKCIIRDHVQRAALCNAACAERVVAEIIRELRAEGYEITTANAPRRPV